MSELDTRGNTSRDHASKVTMKAGFEFYFYEAGYEILAHGSLWSGKETIFVNGKKVSSIRNLTKRIGVQEFQIEEDLYEIEFNMVGILKGELHCTLIKNGVHVKTQKLSAIKPPYFRSPLLKIMLISTISGFIVGFSFIYILKNWY